MEPSVLGVDLGTTYTAAAVGRHGRAEVCRLGTATAAVPSVVVVGEHGDVAMGEAAERRASTEPTRTAREFKRRLRNTTPLMLGGTPYTPEASMAIVLEWVVAQVSQTEGGPPRQVVLTHPANFGPYKLDLMREVGRLADLDDVALISEPQAAAVSCAQRSAIDEGAVVAVYDFGGGTFDATLVQRTAGNGFELIGTPTGMDRLGGIDVDQAVLAHVLENLNVDLDPTDPAAGAVNLPGGQHDRHHQPQRARRPRPPTRDGDRRGDQRAVRLAGLELSGIDRILLVGGTSRMPMVADLLRSTLQRPVALDANPTNAICVGAALIASPAARPASRSSTSCSTPRSSSTTARWSVRCCCSTPPRPTGCAPASRCRAPSKPPPNLIR